MAQFPITIYDRPSISAANLLRGDIGGAATALLAPEKLDPSRISPLHESLMGDLKKEGKKNGFLRGIMSVVSDPLVIAMLFMSSRYPVAGASKLFDIGRKFAGYAHRPGFFEGLFGRAERIFANTPVPKLMVQSTQATNEFTMGWGGKVAGWLEEFKKVTGRYPSAKENIMLGAKLSKMDQPGSVVTQALLKNKIQLSSPLRRLHDHMAQEFFPQFYGEVVGPLRGTDAYGRVLKRVAERAGIDPTHLRRVGVQQIAKMKGYFPRTLIRTPAMVAEYAEEALRAAGGDPQKMQGLAQSAAVSKVSGHALPRRGGLIPSRAELASIGELNPAAWRAIDGRLSGMAKSLINGPANRPDLGAAAKLADLFARRKAGAIASSEVVDGIQAFLRTNRILPSQFRQAISGIHQAVESGNLTGAKQQMFNVIRAGVGERQFSLSFMPVVNNYIHSFSRPFVWSVKKLGKGIEGVRPDLTLGEALVGVPQKSKEALRYAQSMGIPVKKPVSGIISRLSPPLQHMMKSDYMPILQGMTTESQTQGMLRWANIKMKAIQALGDPKGMANLIPQATRDNIIGMLTNEKGGFGYLNAQAKVAGYFYYSALGFNPASAFQNLMQPIITTMPMVGPKAFWQGLRTTTRKMGQYYNLRGAGTPSTEAIAKAFPEFAKAGLGPEPLSEAILRDSLEGMWTGAKALPSEALATGGKPWLERIKRLSMSMFSTSERFNRLVSFEAGLAKAKMDGLYKGMIPSTKAVELASTLVRSTQFPAGPGQMPRALLKLPAPWRQFMYFPIRYMGFLAESTRLGGGTARNWGTIARTAGYSAITYKMMRDVAGVDVSRSLMSGALPLPQYEKAPFFPMPLVPPLAGIAGAAAMAATQGDLAPLAQVSGLFLPAGVPLRRAYRSLSPKYARYDMKTPDGKIPIFGANKAMVGAFTPTQLFMRSIGLRPTEVAAEQELTKYLLKHRDSIREMRRAYVEALAAGNPEEAQRIQDAFKRAYPTLGAITVKKSDLKAATDRHRLTRLGRLTRTLPREYRPQFEDAVGAAMANYTVNALGPIESIPMPTLDSSPFQGPYQPPSNLGF